MNISLSSLDLHYLVAELKVLINAKVEKIFQIENELTILFVLHVPDQGKKYLIISPPNVIGIIDFKPTFPTIPPSFCSALRRKLTSAKITNISQIGFERIIAMDFSTKQGDATLNLEFFPPGNIVLHDETKKILSIAKSTNREGKLMRPGNEYVLLPAPVNVFNLNQKDFEKIISTSTKESLVKSLAIELSLGGSIAEEIIFNAKLDKNLLPTKLTKPNLDKLYLSFTELINSKQATNLYGTSLSPIKLNYLESKLTKTFNSFNEGLNETCFKSFELANKKEIEKKQNKVVSKLDKVVQAQSSQVKKLDKSQEENQIKGELIYKNYVELQKLFNQINSLKKKITWNEIKEILKENKLFVSLDEHNGTITLNLPENGAD